MADSNEINALYDKFINTTDAISKEGITEKSIEELTKIDTEVNQLTLNNCENENNISVEGKKVLVSYNPENGEQMVSNEDSDLVKNITEKQLNSLLSSESNNPMDIVKDILDSNSINTETDEAKLASCIVRRMQGEKFNYYEALPESMKTTVNKIIADLYKDGNAPRNARTINRGYVAKTLIDDCVEEYKKDSKNQMDLDTVLSSFDDDVKKMETDISTELGGMMLSFDEERKAEIDAAIKRCEENGNTAAIEKLLTIKNTISSAYEITDFIEFCKNCKIKNSELEKPSRVYDYFNFKYINHKNTINDISYCPTILSRHLPDYSIRALQAMCMAFCKFCQNMSPDNIAEHTFMYYFIRNIIAIDRVNPKGNLYNSLDEKSKSFYNGFITNIKSAIDNIIERNKDRI